MHLGRDPGPGRPDHTTVRVNRREGDVRIANHDLVIDGDFVIPTDVGLDAPPFIGGGTRSVLAVESTDAANFSIKFEFGILDDEGEFLVDYVYDSTKDANMAGDNDYYISIDPVRDRVRITLSDVSGGTNNRIRGGLNSA